MKSITGTYVSNKNTIKKKFQTNKQPKKKGKKREICPLKVGKQYWQVRNLTMTSVFPIKLREPRTERFRLC